MSLLDVLPEEKRNRLVFLINRGSNPGALNDLTRALSVVEADPELSAKATGERWNLMVYWDKSPIGKIPLMEIYPNESYGHSDWQSCFSNADYFVNLGAPERLGYSFYNNVDDIRKLTRSALSSQKDKAARKINQLVADLKKGTGKAGRSTWKIHSPVTNLHFEEGIMKNKKAKTVAEDHGSELLTVIDVVELADSITKAGRPFYIDTDHEVENGLDVWAVNSETGEDYPRSWRVMDDLSVLVFNTDKNGNSDLVDEKSFENIHELGAWLAKEFADLAGKNESGERDEWDKLTLESTGLIEPVTEYISHVVPAACTVTIYDEQPNQPTDDQMVDIKFKVRIAFDDNAAFVYDGECTQTYTGEGEFGLHSIPKLYLTPSKESDFTVDTSKVLKGWAGGSLAFRELADHINSTLGRIPEEELFRRSPKLGSIYIAKDMRGTIYPRMRSTAIAILYPEPDMDYNEFDYDTAESILYSYFDDYMLQYSNAVKKIKKEVDAGKVFASLSDMRDYATDCFADEYTAEELKDIVIDGIENPSDD